MAVLERDGHSSGTDVLCAMDGVGREGRLTLLAVGDDRRAGLLETSNRVAYRGVEEGVHPIRRKAPLHAFDELESSRDGTDGFGRKSHGAKLIEIGCECQSPHASSPGRVSARGR